MSTKFLFARWRPDVYWWSHVVLIRSLILMVIPLVATESPRAQMLMVTTTLIGCTVLQVRFWPWRLPLLNVMDSLYSLLLALIGVTATAFIAQERGEGAGDFAVMLVTASTLLCVFALAVFTAGLVSLALFGRLARVPTLLHLQRVPPTVALQQQLAKVAETLAATPGRSLNEALAALPLYDVLHINNGLQVLTGQGLVPHVAGWRGSAIRLNRVDPQQERDMGMVVPTTTQRSSSEGALCRPPPEPAHSARCRPAAEPPRSPLPTSFEGGLPPEKRRSLPATAWEA